MPQELQKAHQTLKASTNAKNKLLPPPLKQNFVMNKSVEVFLDNFA